MRSYDEGRAYAYEECAEYLDQKGLHDYATLFRSRIPKDTRPRDCRNRLRDEGKAYPKSGCAHCRDGGIRGCIYEKDRI